MTQDGHGRGFLAGDALRGVALVCVVGFHLVATVAVELGVGRAWLIGVPGALAFFSVYVFFALSGYLLGLPFLRATITGGRLPAPVPYLRNRALRILPAYVLLMAATLVLFGRNGSSWSGVAIHVGFGQVYEPVRFTEVSPHTWTLANEVVFYLALPLVLLPLGAVLRGRGSPVSRALGIAAGLVVAFAASVGWQAHHPDSPELLQPPGNAFAFVAGLLVATLEPIVRPRVTAATPRWPLLVAAAAGFAAWATTRPHLLGTLGAGVACAAVLAAPLVLQWGTGGCWRALDNRVLNWLGARSYSIYLWHVPVFMGVGGLVRKVGLGATEALLASPIRVGLALAVGAISYRFVEVPGFELRRRWHSR